MGKYIFRAWRCSVLDYRATAAYFNDMAAKGWRLKSVSKFWLLPHVACFERDENARRLQYAVDVNMKDFPKALERYYMVYRDLGWRLVGVYRKRLHIFVSEKGGAPPLHTDRQTEWAAMEENAVLDGAVKKNLFWSLLCALVAFWGIRVGITEEILPFVWGLFVFCGLYALYRLALAWSNHRFLKACRRCMEQELPLPEKKPPSRICAWLSVSLAPLALLWMLVAYICEYYIYYAEDVVSGTAFSALIPGFCYYGIGFAVSMSLLYGGLCGTLVHPESRAARILRNVGCILWLVVLSVLPPFNL